MTAVLLTLMQHMRWADALIAESLGRDAPDDAVRLFAHIAAVEHLWLARVRGEPAAIAVWPVLTTHEARAVAAEHADHFEQLIRSADDAALARRASYRNSAGRIFESTVADIVTHVAMHGSHHRGQILQRLRAAGFEPPYVDFIQFTRRDQLE